MINHNLTKTFKILISAICICAAMTFTTVKANAGSQPFVGEIMCGGWNFCPSGWMECNGALIPISEFETLFNLIGTTYGGDGEQTFAIPDLQGRTIIGQGQGSGLTNRVIGETGGFESITLTSQQMPSHNHSMNIHGGSEKSASPTNRIPAVQASNNAYSTTAPNAVMTTTSSIGNGQPHENRQPYLVNKCCISMYGIFPTQN